MEQLYVVRLYDGMDMMWMDVSEAVSRERAEKIWNGKTNGGTKKTCYDEIDYFEIFPADTRIVYNEDGINLLGR